jgi:hypothetical protein
MLRTPGQELRRKSGADPDLTEEVGSHLTLTRGLGVYTNTGSTTAVAANRPPSPDLRLLRREVHRAAGEVLAPRDYWHSPHTYQAKTAIEVVTRFVVYVIEWRHMRLRSQPQLEPQPSKRTGMRSAICDSAHKLGREATCSAVASLSTNAAISRANVRATCQNPFRAQQKSPRDRS